MLLDTLGDERNEALKGDELLSDLNEISEAHQRSTINATKSPNAAKIAKDMLNSKEKRCSRSATKHIPDREAIQCRANSLKRAMHNVMEHSKLLDNKQRRFGPAAQDHLCVFTSSSSDTTPWSSPVPPINILSPSVSTTQLTCISPLPDLRRDSMDDYFFSSVDLPVPMQFADGSSRRGSANIPQSIAETNEAMADLFPLCKDTTQKVSASHHHNHLKNSTPSSLVVNVVAGHQQKPQMCHLDYLDSCYNPHDNPNDDRGLMPAEAFERMQLMRNRTINPALHPEPTTKNASSCPTPNMLQVPTITMPPMEIQRPPTVVTAPPNNGLPHIDSEQPVSIAIFQYSDCLPHHLLWNVLPKDASNSDDNPGEASDVLSAMSNEECSIASEILDKHAESFPIHVADIIQVISNNNAVLECIINYIFFWAFDLKDLESDQLGHIDSPENSETTDALHDESLIDDISSVLGHDMLGALQDNTLTEETTTLCAEGRPKRRSLKKKKAAIAREDSEEAENPLQFGFENIVFEIDNRCDDQKKANPVKYCSLARFVEGNDIARKSFKVMYGIRLYIYI